MVVGIEQDYPPFSFFDKDGKATGFDVEITTAIAQVMGITVDIKMGKWHQIRNNLANGRIDAIGGMYYTPERSRDFLFSAPYAVIHHAIFARKDAPAIHSEAELRDKKLIVVQGDIMHEYVVQHELTKNIVPADTQAEALRLLASGKCDYAILAKVPGLYWIEQLKLANLTTTGPLLCPAENCFAAQRNREDVIETFSEGLVILKQTGKYREIHDRWFGVYEPAQAWAVTVLKYVGLGCAVLAVCLVCAVLWSTNLRRQVAARTVELRQELAVRQQMMVDLAAAKQAADSANRAKSEFLANMSHELRTPLTAILGFSERILIGDDEADTLKAAGIINRNGEHLLSIIDDVLDLSRIESGRLKIEIAECSPKKIVRDVLSTMEASAETKGLTLSGEYAGNVPDRVRTDPVRLRRILVNLVGNAIKFTEAGSVRIFAWFSADTTDGPKLRFDVIDTGIGVSEAQLPLLFESFSQVDGSSKRRFGGSGLGLAISRRLARLLGGDIEVTTELGQGSTFRVTVAAEPCEGSASVGEPPEASESRVPMADKMGLNCRILLAEDSPDNQRLIMHVLQKASADVILAEDGRRTFDLALGALRSGEPFDVVLMDMQMPIMDGYETTRQLRRAGYTGPIVALTAHAMKGDRKKCLDAGCDDYLTKPVDRHRLVATVARHLKESPDAASAVAVIRDKTTMPADVS